jgi:hypothetical protein
MSCAHAIPERQRCLLVLDSVTCTPQWIRQPRPHVYLTEGTAARLGYPWQLYVELFSLYRMCSLYTLSESCAHRSFCLGDARQVHVRLRPNVAG